VSLFLVTNEQQHRQKVMVPLGNDLKSCLCFDCMCSGISSGPNAWQQVWKNLTLFTLCVDLKKTVAVLLENLIDRVNVLEQKVTRLSSATQSSTGSFVLQPAIALPHPSSTVANEPAVNVRGMIQLKTSSRVSK